VQKFDQIQVVAAQEPYETKPDDFGVENWRASALERLCNTSASSRLGRDLVVRQPSSVRDRSTK